MRMRAALLGLLLCAAIGCSQGRTLEHARKLAQLEPNETFPYTKCTGRQSQSPYKLTQQPGSQIIRTATTASRVWCWDLTTVDTEDDFNLRAIYLDIKPTCMGAVRTTDAVRFINIKNETGSTVNRTVAPQYERFMSGTAIIFKATGKTQGTPSYKYPDGYTLGGQTGLLGSYKEFSQSTTTFCLTLRIDSDKTAKTIGCDDLGNFCAGYTTSGYVKDPSTKVGKCLFAFINPNYSTCPLQEETIPAQG